MGARRPAGCGRWIAALLAGSLVAGAPFQSAWPQNTAEAPGNAAPGTPGATQAPAAPADAKPADPRSDLMTLEQGIAQSRERTAALRQRDAEFQREISAFQTEAVAAAQTEQANEAKLARFQADLADLDRQAAAKRAALEAHRAHQSEILAALQRVAILPPAAVAFSPGTPLDAERTAMLLGALIPRLHSRAEELANNLAQLAALGRRMNEEQNQIAEAQATIRSERQRLLSLVVQRQALQASNKQAARAEQRRLNQLSRRATSLRDLTLRIEHERAARTGRAAPTDSAPGVTTPRVTTPGVTTPGGATGPRAAVDAAVLHPAAASFGAGTPGSSSPAVNAAVIAPGSRPSAQLRLVRPATGRIVTAYGAGDEFATAKGVSIATAPGAEVVAPADGTIMFAGQFKGYGQILIIDHGGGYHSLLAGLDRLHCMLGQKIVAGEPVGTMRSAGLATLYFELRQQGQPIDPLPALDRHD